MAATEDVVAAQRVLLTAVEDRVDEFRKISEDGAKGNRTYMFCRKGNARQKILCESTV